MRKLLESNGVRLKQFDGLDDMEKIVAANDSTVERIVLFISAHINVSNSLWI